jgi:tryptophan synthase alpha chain
MENRIDRKFKELKARRKKAFIAYITAGDPSLLATAKLALEIEKSGVDILELGIPFSDPMADGPTIQAASHRALEGGVKLAGIFKMVRSLRKKTGMPIVFMTYYNPVFRYGVEKFLRDCSRSGVDGIIVPDLPCEESAPLVKAAKKNGVAAIFLAAPTSTISRLKKIASLSGGFIYYVSLTGVTGTRRDLPEELGSKVRCIKSMTDTPVSVGFGVSNPGQAKKVAKIADGVIVGSAIVNIIAQNMGKRDMAAKVARFTKTIAKAVHSRET